MGMTMENPTLCVSCGERRISGIRSRTLCGSCIDSPPVELASGAERVEAWSAELRSSIAELGFDYGLTFSAANTYPGSGDPVVLCDAACGKSAVGSKMSEEQTIEAGLEGALVAVVSVQGAAQGEEKRIRLDILHSCPECSAALSSEAAQVSLVEQLQEARGFSLSTPLAGQPWPYYVHLLHS